MEIEFTLTEKGLDNYDFVIKSFFIWMNYIMTVYSSPGVWDIMQKIAEYDFYYMRQKTSTSDTSDLASNMHRYPFRYIYSGDSVFFDKDDVSAHIVLDQIHINNTVILLSSPKMEDPNSKVFTKLGKVDEFYNTKYSVQKYSLQRQREWGEAKTLHGKLYLTKGGEYLDSNLFHIPSKNKYIPMNLDMVCPDRWFIVRVKSNYLNECSDEAFAADGNNIVAKMISVNKKGEMWFKQDRSFLIPTANINVRLETDKGNVDLVEASKLFFFESLLAEWIMDNLYDALQMGYSFTFAATTNGIEFSVSGFNDKIPELTQNVLYSFRHLEMTQESFDRVKDKYITDLKAEQLQKPYMLAFLYTKIIYQEHGHTIDEILEVGEKLKLEDVTEFHKKLFDHVYVKSLVHGNMAAEQALELKDHIDTILNFGVLENPAKIKPKIHILDGPYAYIYPLFSKDEEDSAIFNSYQVVYLRKDHPEDLKDLLFLDITASLISTFAYDYLRTERLLGYIVSSASFSIGRTGYLYILIQGTRAAPDLMDNEIENMLRAFRQKDLADLTDKKFEALKKSIVQKLTSPDKSLSDRTARIWREIVERDKDFHIRDKLVHQLEKAKLEELLSFYEKKIIPEDISTVKKLSVQFYSVKKHPIPPIELKNATTPYKQINKLNDNLVELQF